MSDRHAGAASIERTLGQLTASIENVKDLVTGNRDERKEFEARIEKAIGQSEVRIENNISALKHETRNYQQIVTGRLELASIEQVRQAERIMRIEDQIEALDKPVAQIINFGARIGAIRVMLVSAALVLWALIGPTIGGWTGRLLGKLWP